MRVCVCKDTADLRRVFYILYQLCPIGVIDLAHVVFRTSGQGKADVPYSVREVYLNAAVPSPCKYGRQVLVTELKISSVP